MAEYIEREAAVDALVRLCKRVCQYSEKERQFMCGACPLGDAFTVIEDDLPAADVWEVVHCADCVHAEESLVSGCVYCNEMERARIKEGFCAWGERKENDG